MIQTAPGDSSDSATDEPTLSVMLEQYAIGAKVRALRRSRRMGLVELGRHSSLSPSLLSKIERGRVCPPLGTLLRIAMVFSVGLDHFFSDDQRKPVVAISRAAQRRRFPNHHDMTRATYEFESLDFGATDRVSNSYLAHFAAMGGEEADPHTHSGFETIYVIDGSLVLTVAGRVIELDRGDSIYFDSSIPHTYRRTGDAECHAVVLTVP